MSFCVGSHVSDAAHQQPSLECPQPLGGPVFTARGGELRPEARLDVVGVVDHSVDAADDHERCRGRRPVCHDAVVLVCFEPCRHELCRDSARKSTWYPRYAGAPVREGSPQSAGRMKRRSSTRGSDTSVASGDGPSNSTYLIATSSDMPVPSRRPRCEGLDRSLNMV